VPASVIAMVFASLKLFNSDIKKLITLIMIVYLLIGCSSYIRVFNQIFTGADNYTSDEYQLWMMIDHLLYLSALIISTLVIYEIKIFNESFGLGGKK
jgi:formate hydrogenlyase subunit 3/multisubunit Na+/H+ antiporter MnhD subunit